MQPIIASSRFWIRIKHQIWQYLVIFYLNQFSLAHENLFEHTWIDLATKTRGKISVLKKMFAYSTFMARAHIRIG